MRWDLTWLDINRRTDAMPRRTVYCRHPSCGYSVDISIGKVPSHCASCGRGGKWSVEPITEGEPEPVEYLLTRQDKRLLWLFYISQD